MTSMLLPVHTASEDSSNPSTRLVVVVRVTTACWHGCRYCGYSRDVVRSRTEIPLDPLLRLGQLLAELRESYHRDVHVSWLGGEPFQWSALRQATPTFRDFGLTLGITTAGAQLTDHHVRRWTQQSFDEITISVDGLAHHHRQQRNTQGYLRLKSAVQALRKESHIEAIHRTEATPRERLWLRANLVLTRLNIDDFAAILVELGQWGFDELTVNQLGGNDRPEFYPDHHLQPNQVARFIDHIPHFENLADELGIKFRCSTAYLHRIQASTLGTRIPIRDCRPGTQFLFVDEFARISPCSFTVGQASVPIANLNCVDDLIGLPSLFTSLRSAKCPQPCGDCHATHMFDKFTTKQLQLTLQTKGTSSV